MISSPLFKYRLPRLNMQVRADADRRHCDVLGGTDVIFCSRPSRYGLGRRCSVVIARRSSVRFAPRCSLSFVYRPSGEFRPVVSFILSTFSVQSAAPPSSWSMVWSVGLLTQWLLGPDVLVLLSTSGWNTSSGPLLILRIAVVRSCFRRPAPPAVMALGAALGVLRRLGQTGTVCSAFVDRPVMIRSGSPLGSGITSPVLYRIHRKIVDPVLPQAAEPTLHVLQELFSLDWS